MSLLDTELIGPIPGDELRGPIMGVDPGLKGGLAFLDGTLHCYDIPTAGVEVDVEEVVRLIRQHNPVLAVVERAGSMPKQGVSSTFKFGVAYGMLRGAITACNVPTHLVSATTWKKRFALDRDKEKSRALALRRWPGTGFFQRKLDHGRAEAALLAQYGIDVVSS